MNRAVNHFRTNLGIYQNLNELSLTFYEHQKHPENIDAYIHYAWGMQKSEGT